MKQLIVNFLRPYVLRIMKEHLKITRTRGGMVADVIVEEEPKPTPPPPDPIPPIIP